MAGKEGHEHNQKEGRLDDTIDDSFPASDPPSNPGISGVGKRHRTEKPHPTEERAKEGERDKARPSHQRDEHARPTGHPTSERHATETVHKWEDEKDA